MNPHSFIPAMITFITAIIAALVGVYSWQRRTVRGGIFFVLLMAAIAVYAFAVGGELSSLSISTNIIWSKISYLGVVSLSPLWFLFAASYSQRKNWLTTRRIAILWVIPVLTLLLAATNEYHRLIWPSIAPESAQPGARVIYGQGILFWFHVAYAYVLMMVGTIWFILAARQSKELLRNQVFLLLAATLIPWFANFLYIFKINPWPGLDLTPIAFLISGLVFFFNLFRYKMLDLLPIANDIILANISDGVVVLDTKYRIINLNPAARRWLGNSDNLIGHNLDEIAPLTEIVGRYRHFFEGQTQLDFIVDGNHQVFDVTISPVKNEGGQLEGRVIVLHDISREKAMLGAEQQRSRQMELLNEITGVALSNANLEEILQVMGEKLGQLFNADGTLFSLWDDKQQRIIFTAIRGKLVCDSNETLLESFTLAVLNNQDYLAVENTLNFNYFQFDRSLPAHSLLAFPLNSHSQKLGIVVVCFNQPRSFNMDEINLGKQVSGQVALAIDKVQLYNRELHRADQLKAIQSVSQVITSSLDLQRIFETVVEVLRNTFGYHYISIYRLEGDVLRFGAQYGYPEELLPHDIPITQGIVGRTVRTRTAQFVPDVSSDADFLRSSYEVGQEICVPLIKGESILGILNIESGFQDLLTEDDLNLLLTFAQQVVVAIDHANLFQSERDQRKLADALRQVGFAMSESLNLETVLDRLLDGLKKVVPYDTANVMLISEDQKQGAVIRKSGYDQFMNEVDYKSADIKYDIPSTPNLKYMVDSGKSLIIPDVNLDPNWIILDKFTHFHSWAGTPITVKDKVVAFLSVEKIEVNFYNPEHIHRLTAFASQAAVAIENARLYAEVQQLAIRDELTGLYNRRGFFEIGRRELERAKRTGRPLTALFLDVDHFKLFNDTYSYEVGDQVLILLADCMRTHLRAIDLIGRYGGEEFVVILPEMEEQPAKKVAERLRHQIETMEIKVEEGIIHLTVSIGVCQKTESTSDLETLLARAGQALHKAKNSGRNCVMVGEPEIVDISGVDISG
ncbi:MAG: histidine kinase N-terminal 7TM domain-containing protein [Anaerolineaceae bacterium]|nr:histidine kinase N-terminal 7TM domain-containing protein [Anaerolineaceae bacterium]